LFAARFRKLSACLLLHGALVTPTLVKIDLEPIKRLIGVLSDKAKILIALNIAAA
jgi:hypothetical protein